MNRTQQFLASPALIIDLEKAVQKVTTTTEHGGMIPRTDKVTTETESSSSVAAPKKPKMAMKPPVMKSELPLWAKGMYDQARRQVKAKQAIKQTEEAVSEETTTPELPKPKFTGAHLEAAKQKMQAQKSEMPVWFQKGEEADTVKDKPKGTSGAAGHSKSAWVATTATKTNNTVAGHKAAMEAHTKAGSAYTKLRSRAQDRASQAYGAHVNTNPKIAKHAEKAKEHWNQVHTHRQKIEALGGTA